MATPFTHVLVAAAVLATVYFDLAASGNAWADDVSAVAHVPAERVQWHSGLTATSSSCVTAQWKSALSAIDLEDSTAVRVMPGAVGLKYVADNECGYSPGSLDTSEGARKSAQGPARVQGASAGTAR